MANLRFLHSIAWWLYVIVTPDINNKTVLSKGIPRASISWKKTGGHTAPIKILGDNALWKKAQKNEKKNIISEIINNTIPAKIPRCTAKVWWPSYVASIIMSLNHLDMIKVKTKQLK